MKPADLPYRPCVGITLFNRDNRVFVARRIDTIAEAWQMPQGGIDDGESPRVTALRELKEEIGTDKAEIIAEIPGWLDYDLPEDLIGKLWGGKYRGQRQKWFAMRFLGSDSDINLNTPHPEFLEWRWEKLERVPELIVPFKRELYRRIAEAFAELAA
ncbi:MAG: RNA pyrophosphohydrolase [Alphaproteobacteria bacterium]|nr:RNA pyrophosphohydrolase [Alphaproteobacteria bacterium]